MRRVQVGADGGGAESDRRSGGVNKAQKKVGRMAIGERKERRKKREEK